MTTGETIQGNRWSVRGQKAWFVLSAAFAFTIPFAPGVNSALAIGLLLLWLFLPKRMDLWRDGWLMLALSFPFWIAAVGMAYTENTEEGLFRLQQKALLLLLPLLFLNAAVDRMNLARSMLSFFVAGVALACIASLAAGLFIGRGAVAPLVGHGLARHLDLYPYIFSLLCLVGLLVLAEAERGRIQLYPGINRRVRCGLAILFILVLLLLAVQQVILIWFLLTVTYAANVLPWKTTALVLLVMAVVLSATAIWVPPLREKVTDVLVGSSRNTIPLDQDGPMQQEWNGIAVRKAIWTCAWDAIRENPVLGVGTGDGQDALQQAYARRKFHLGALYNRYNAHNQYVQMLVCAGFVGLALWGAAIGWLLWRFRAHTLFVLAFAALLMSMLTESMLETNKGSLLMAFVLSVLLLPAPEKSMPTVNQ